MNVAVLCVNGTTVRVEPRGSESLLHVLRDQLGLSGTKGACEQGECGSCSVIMDGELVCSCLVMAADADGVQIITVEGLAPDGNLHPAQEAFLAHGAVQCGFCTPGFVVSASHLLDRASRVATPLSELDVREALAGNLCRCTGYGAIIRAVMSVGSDAR